MTWRASSGRPYAAMSTVGFPLVGGPAGSMEAGRQAEVAQAILTAKVGPAVGSRCRRRPDGGLGGHSLILRIPGSRFLTEMASYDGASSTCTALVMERAVRGGGAAAHPGHPHVGQHRRRGQGLTLVHFSPQPEPFLTP